MWQSVNNNYAVRNFNNNNWVVDSGLTNQFEYQQNVFGVYTTGAIEKNNTGLKLGLRLEKHVIKYKTYYHQ